MEFYFKLIGLFFLFAPITGCISSSNDAHVENDYYVVRLVGFDGYRNVALFVEERLIFSGYPADDLYPGDHEQIETYANFYAYCREDVAVVKLIIEQSYEGKIGRDVIISFEKTIFRTEGRYIEINFNNGEIELRQAIEIFP